MAKPNTVKATDERKDDIGYVEESAEVDLHGSMFEHVLKMTMIGDKVQPMRNQQLGVICKCRLRSGF